MILFFKLCKFCRIYIASVTYIYGISDAVRAGTGGDEAGIWAGDIVGTHISFNAV